MRRMFLTLSVTAVFCLAIAGCGVSGGKVSEEKPISAVKSEAKAMSDAQLNDMVSKYKAAIESKKSELGELLEKIKKIPITELFGDEAKMIQADVRKISDSVQALAERLNVYAQELSSKR